MVGKNDKRYGGQLQKAVKCQYDNQQNSMIVKCQYDSLLNTMRSWEHSVVCYDIISCHPLVFEELVSSDTVLSFSAPSREDDLGPHILTVKSSDTEAII